jgi:hypothetical protein
MISETVITSDKLRNIVMSKVLSNVLTAFFHEDRNTSFSTLVKNHAVMFRYWAHETDIDYDSFLRVVELEYNSQVNFEISDKKITFGKYYESYSSWIVLTKDVSIFIIWNLESP